MLALIFTAWQVLAQPDLVPPFVWENPNRASFFFGEPVKIFRVIWEWFTGGAIYQHLWVTLQETALAFVIGHPAVTAAIIGPRTMDQLESQLPAADALLDPGLLDRIDEIVPPGTNINPADDGWGWANPALKPAARRR